MRYRVSGNGKVQIRLWTIPIGPLTSPNNAREGCVLLLYGFRNISGWDNEQCIRSYNFICKKKASPVASDDGWMSYGQTCILFSDILKENWTQAAHHCAAHRANLAIADSSGKDAFLREQTRKLVKCKDEYAVFWIGANRIGSGVWKWYTNNQPVVNFNWSPEQPQNRTGEDCLIYTNYDKYGGWHDDYCTDRGYFICEKLAYLLSSVIG